MKTHLFILALMILPALISCQKNTELTGDARLYLNDTLELATRKSAVNEENKISVTIDSVLNDSRCPADALCVWAGNAAVRFIFCDQNEQIRFVLNTYGGSQFPSDTVIGSYSIKLTSLQPYPFSSHHIEQDEYIAALVINQLP